MLPLTNKGKTALMHAMYSREVNQLSFYLLFSIALALSLDAFGVAVCIGLNNQVRRNNKYLFALSFGFFQFLFSLIGAYAGFLFSTYIADMPEVVEVLLLPL
jgi:putative Mn2+ efflux pump MntP